MGPQGARSAFSGCHSRSERHFQSPVDNLPAGDKPRRQIAAFYIKQSAFAPPRSVTSLARAVSRRPPHRHPPCVFRSPTPFSACSQHTGSGKPGLCVVCLPAISAFQRYSTHHLLRCRSPFGFHFCFRSAPSGFVQRTGCSACGLGYPHQVGWSPPMYIVHSSCLVPVSFAGMSTYLRLQACPFFSHCRFV
jgi:hypothetical protein